MTTRKQVDPPAPPADQPEEPPPTGRFHRIVGRRAAWLHIGRGGAVKSYRALLASWPVRGYNEAGAGHLSAILAYNALVALVPTTLLLVSVRAFCCVRTR
jgi:hypothetical protein